ncbi:MAG TPA: hypothetical protein VG518_10530, partial [Solirubrobacterales bacterium]|nr:hypothetical protein [Solirubrobacterales bacterium]
EERAPGRGLLLRTIETYVIGTTSYQLVVPGYVPSRIDAEFRRVSLYRLSERGAIGSGPMQTFEDRHQALRWLASQDLARPSPARPFLRSGEKARANPTTRRKP